MNVNVLDLSACIGLTAVGAVTVNTFLGTLMVLRYSPLRSWPHRKFNVVCTASYEARAFGIRSAMLAVQAERLCPGGFLVPPDFTRYRAVSQSVREILKRHTDLTAPGGPSDKAPATGYRPK